MEVSTYALFEESFIDSGSSSELLPREYPKALKNEKAMKKGNIL